MFDTGSKISPPGPGGVESPTATSFWAVTAPFLVTEENLWLSDFVADDRFRFQKVHQSKAEQSWHSKKVARTGPAEWLKFNDAARRSLRLAAKNHGGVITVFPQLAAATGLQKSLTRRTTPLISWFFNTNIGEGSQKVLARRALSTVDRFVVHSTVEIEAYSNALGLPPERFVFAPVQYGGAVATDEESIEEPFVFATGSGFRDYRTMFEAVERLGYHTKIVAGDRVLAGIPVPDNVEILNDTKRPDIHRMMRQARVNVVPLTNDGLTAGIITIAETYRHGRAIVLTRRSGLEDYIVDGITGLHAEPGNVASMAEGIEAIWNDAELRAALNEGAAHFGEDNCSDEAAARNLISVIENLR